MAKKAVAKKAVIFDVGGVLAHDVWESLLPHIASKYSLDPESANRIGNALWESFAYRGATGRSERDALEREYWNAFIKGFGLRRVSPGRFIALTPRFIKPVKGMDTLLGRLWNQGIELLIGSNNNEFWFERQMRLGYRRFFKGPGRIFLSCGLGVPKSNPAFFDAVLKGLRKLRCKPENTVFVDDRESNVDTALGRGLRGILFPQHADWGSKYLEVLLRGMGYL